MKLDFQFFEPNVFLLQVKFQKISIFGKKIYFCWKIFDPKNNNTKIEN